MGRTSWFDEHGAHAPRSARAHAPAAPTAAGTLRFVQPAPAGRSQVLRQLRRAGTSADSLVPYPGQRETVALILLYEVMQERANQREAPRIRTLWRHSP